VFWHGLHYITRNSLIKVLAFLLFSSLQLESSAEKFTVRLSGEEIKNTSAIILKLKIDPINFFYLDDNFEIEGLDENDFLFKTVDAKNLILRIFFSDNFSKKNISSLLIEGDIIRKNYNGKLNFSIDEVLYISDFSKFFDSSLIKYSAEISEGNENLPFLGISKAEILGPQERIFSESMDISISGIETYGFELADENISDIFINGQRASLVNNRILVSSLNLQDYPLSQIPIEIEIHVKNKVVKKNLEPIKLLKL
jgi:hypothetical protein